MLFDQLHSLLRAVPPACCRPGVLVVLSLFQNQLAGLAAKL